MFGSSLNFLYKPALALILIGALVISGAANYLDARSVYMSGDAVSIAIITGVAIAATLQVAFFLWAAFKGYTIIPVVGYTLASIALLANTAHKGNLMTGWTLFEIGIIVLMWVIYLFPEQVTGTGTKAHPKDTSTI